MRQLPYSAFELAQRFAGTKEIPGSDYNPSILSMLKLDNDWPTDDEVPWCSAFVNYIAWLLRLPRSKSLLARSWLEVGEPILPGQCEPGFDVVVLWRGAPDSDSGHVGFFAGFQGREQILLLGGNQGDTVKIAAFDNARIIGARRLA